MQSTAAILYTIRVRAKIGVFIFCTGIENRIPYLQEQGINNVWVNSFYLSDNILDGDDIVDHKKINPIMGDRVTFDGLKKIMRKKGKTKANFT